jgi:hypothetical protein
MLFQVKIVEGCSSLDADRSLLWAPLLWAPLANRVHRCPSRRGSCHAFGGCRPVDAEATSGLGGYGSLRRPHMPNSERWPPAYLSLVRI